MAEVVRTTGLMLYLWSVFMQFSRVSGLGINELLYFRVISPEEIGYIFSAAPAKDFGGDFTSSYDEIFLVPADPADGCSDLEDIEIIRGQVVLVERGGCSFVQKARHVEEAGGKAVLIADNAVDNDSQYLDMITDGSTAKPSIPALFLLGRDGMMIRRSLQRQALPWAVISIPVNVSSLASFPLKQPPWTLCFRWCSCRKREREREKERRKVEMELPNHAKQLLLQLNQQRAKGFLCDVIIVVENALFRAHKNILAASSIYFKSLVLHDNLINLDTEMVNPSVFRQVLDFIYTGKLLSSSDQSSEQNFSALLTAASYLQLHDLAALCRKKLKRSGGKPLPGKPSTPGPLSRLRLNNQRLSSSTPAGPNNHYPPTPSDADQPQPDEGLRDKLSDDEMFVGSSARNGNGGNGSSNGNLSSGGSAGEPDLGLDLSKKSPPSAGTATDALSPHSNSQESPQSASVSTTNSASLDDSSTTLPGVDNCGSESMELNSSSKASDETQNQPDGPPPQKKTRQGARKNEWPKKEASGLKSEDHDRPLVNGVIVGPKDGRSSDHSFQCKDEEEGGENGQDHTDESGQSDGESAGGGGGTGGGHHSANYVYRQEGFEPAFGDNLYVCIPCGKGFPSSEQLNAHVETHNEDELYIKEEGGTFVKEEDEEEAEDLSAPVGPSNFGSEARPFKCTVCSKSYKDPATLRQHEKSHWLTRPFPCNICGKMFTQRGTMTRHMRSHLGLKPFACEECGMRFTRQYRLTEHMRVHSGEKPYECQLCGGKFTQQRNLISHLRMHTSPS